LLVEARSVGVAEKATKLYFEIKTNGRIIIISSQLSSTPWYTFTHSLTHLLTYLFLSLTIPAISGVESLYLVTPEGLI
jgi:hypothetical protein